MNVRLGLALLAGHLAGAVSRRLGGGGGTVLPGHIVSRIDPQAVPRIVRRLPHGAVLITGTNGKTTTARMVAQICAAAGLRPIHNRSGANLMTGITSAVVARTDLRGNPQGDLGLFEVDEANLPAAVQAVQPRIVALTNVFRDQLDRYGEVDLVARTWRAALAELGEDSTLVLNADDPSVAQLADAAPGRVLTFGVEDTSVGNPVLPHEADRRLCPRCGDRLRYSWSYYGHVGHYECGQCGWQRPQPDIVIRHLSTDPKGQSNVILEAEHEQVAITLPLSGTYNAYNALAAAAVAKALSLPTDAVVQGLSSVAAAFGRQEEIPLGDGRLLMALVKNPVGFNQVLQTLVAGTLPGLLVIAINDQFADGTDISWLWDVDFEMLAERAPPILCTGLRAEDMALRLKYALRSDAHLEVEPNLDRALDCALRTAQAGEHVALLPTYTAMLAMRRELQRRGHVAPFWET